MNKGGTNFLIWPSYLTVLILNVFNLICIHNVRKYKLHINYFRYIYLERKLVSVLWISDQVNYFDKDFRIVLLFEILKTMINYCIQKKYSEDASKLLLLMNTINIVKIL